MNKEKIINKISELKLDKNEFWVVGSAALVLRNILDTANDIDIAITYKQYEELTKKQELVYLGTNHNSKWYKINDCIECCIDEMDKEKVEISEPFNLINLEYYYNSFIKNSTREKDIEKKRLIEKEISKIWGDNND